MDLFSPVIVLHGMHPFVPTMLECLDIATDEWAKSRRILIGGSSNRFAGPDSLMGAQL